MKGALALMCGYAVLACLAVPAALFGAQDEHRGGDGIVAAPDQIDGAPSAPPAPVAQPDSPEKVTPARQQTHDVAMRNIEFVPREITVNLGDTITWRNEDAEPHNAIANDQSFRTETIRQGETVSATIDQAGEHPYFCSIHAGMTGTVTTAGSDPESDGSEEGTDTGTDTSGTPGGGGIPGVLPGPAPATAVGGGRSGTSSLPATGSDVGWFAMAGAWLLTVGAATRAAILGGD